MYFALARILILSRPKKCCFALTNGAILDGCRKYQAKMEEQLERKDEAAAPKEPIKTEEVARSPETSERSDGATSPPPNCSICLGKLINTSFTDSCLHQFCFTCLLQWSKIKTECPLCKQIFKSIIHNVRSEEDYDQYHIPRQFAPPISTSQVAASLDMNLDFGVNLDIGDGLRRFSYRTTHLGGRRMPRSLLNPEQVARQEQMPSVIPQVSREEQRRRRLNPADYRRIVYRHGVWASPLYDVFGRSRDCSVEYYRRNPEELTRLVPWLNRELQVLLNNRAPHVAYVMRVIIDALSQYDMRSSEFRDVIRPYFNMHTDHFAHELENYARTNYDLVGYDQSVTYVPSYGLSNEYVSRIPSYNNNRSSSTSTNSDDSDVRILDQTIDMSPLNAELPNVGPNAIAMPGPSTVGQSLHLQMPYRYPDVFTVSSDTSTSEDECEVVGFVKPRHERTPEIIELVSSDGGDLNTTSAPPESIKISSYSSLTEENQPGTSKSKKKLKTKRSARSRASDVLSPSTSSSDTDSSYMYFAKRRKSLKTGARRSSKRGDDVGGRKLSETSDGTECEKNAEHVPERTTARVAAQRKAKHRYLSSSSDSSSDSEEEWTRSSRRKKKKKKKKKSETAKKSRAAGATKTCKESSAKRRRCTADDLSSDSSSSETVGSNRRGLDKSRTSKDTRLSSLSDSSLAADDTQQAMIDDKSRVASVIVSPTNPTEKVEVVHADTAFLEKKINSESINDVEIRKPEAKRRYPIDENDDDHDDDDDDDERGKNKTRKSAKKPEDRGDRNFAIKLLSRIYESRRTKRDSGSSDLEEATTRSGRPSSQCSTASEKAHASRRKSKHKDKHKEKKDKRSSRASRSSLKSSPSASGTSGVTSSRNDVSTTSKHSDSKTSSSSKERHRSHKKRRELKHRRSRSESKSKSRRKRRRIKSASTSDFEYRNY